MLYTFLSPKFNNLVYIKYTSESEKCQNYIFLSLIRDYQGFLRSRIGVIATVLNFIGVYIFFPSSKHNIIIYQKTHYNIDQKDERTLDDRRRDGGTNFILRTKEQETRLTLHEHDDDNIILPSILLFLSGLVF